MIGGEERRPISLPPWIGIVTARPVLMDPALGTPSLTAPFKTKPQGSAAELLSAGARHSRWRWCLPAAVVPSHRIRRQSFRTRLRVRPELLLASASAQNTHEWQ